VRRQDVAPDRQEFLERADGHPNAWALVAPPTPRSLPAGSVNQAGLADANFALGELSQSITRIPNTDMVTRTLARREAVGSSRIEGTKSDLHQLLAYEATRDGRGLPEDVRIVERYVEALQYGLDRIRDEGRRALDLALINHLHAILMRDEHGMQAGAYRTHQAWIGSSPRIEDATFVPAPPARIEGCMEEMAASILEYEPRPEEQGSLTLLVQIAIAHAQFETIHPYQDGNGRTGRLLMPLMFVAAGFPPLYLSGALFRARQNYYSALAQVQLQGDWRPWLDLIFRVVVESCRDSTSIAHDLNAIAQGWCEQLSSYRADSATRRMPRFLLGHPVVSVNQVVEGLHVSQPAANAAMNNLLAAGIVELRTANRKWGRVFNATAVLDRLNRS